MDDEVPDNEDFDDENNISMVFPFPHACINEVAKFELPMDMECTNLDLGYMIPEESSVASMPDLIQINPTSDDDSATDISNPYVSPDVFDVDTTLIMLPTTSMEAVRVLDLILNESNRDNIE